MQKETYFVILVPRNVKTGVPYEERDFTIAQDAWEAFRTFAEPTSSENYSEIQLVLYHWDDCTMDSLAHMTFESKGSVEMKRNEALEFLLENESNLRRYAERAKTPQERDAANDMLKVIAEQKEEVLNREEE